MTRSVKVVAGTRNQRCLHLDHAILWMRSGLENRCTGNRTVGSNPTLSAKRYCFY